jgi:hypothetical protein
MNHIISVLDELLVDLPIGTNVAMIHTFWALLSGQLLNSRGALFPALTAIGLEDDEVRRAWTAVSKGVWQTNPLLKQWRKQVKRLPEWKRREYEDYKPVAADVTAFWRPSLKNCPSQHYHPAAQRALPINTLRQIYVCEPSSPYSALKSLLKLICARMISPQRLHFTEIR